MNATVNSVGIGELHLASGEVLPSVDLAYVSYGNLNAAGDNAVLVTHGYTSGPSMLGGNHHTAEGSWANLLGPGRPLDTDKFFIVCSNMLGSSFGTTGPGSINPANGKPYGLDFPQIELCDIVQVQHRLLEALGVKKLQAVLGPSYGGWQAFQWAMQYPNMVRAIGPICSGLTHPKDLSAKERLEKLSSSPEWHGGQYHAHGGMKQTLFDIRLQTIRSYGLERLYMDREPDANMRKELLESQARGWAEKFDPMSLVVLAAAAEKFNVRESLHQLKARLFFAVSSTDAIFPPDAEVERLVRAAPVENRYMEIQSEYGHLASGIEWRQLEEPIRWLLNPPS